MTNWYYIDGPRRVGPFTQEEWDDLTRSGKITPSTLVWHENLTKWTPYGELIREEKNSREEEEDLSAQADPVWTSRRTRTEDSADGVEESFAVPPFDDPAVQPESIAAALQERDYQVPVWRTLKNGLALLSRHPWFLISNTVLAYSLIYLPIPGLDMMMFFALSGVLMGGLSSVYLRTLRQQRPILFDLFSGFRAGYFRNLATKTFIAAWVTLAGVLPIGIAARLLEVPVTEFDREKIDLESLLVLLVVAAAGLLPAAYFNFCWTFAEALIRDKRLPYSVAMRLSREKVLQHPWKLAWVLGLAMVLASLPALLCLVGGLMITVLWASPSEEVLNRLSGLMLLMGLIGFPYYNSVLYSLYEMIFNPGKTADPQAAESAHAHHG